jgi:hypothetical protein
MEQDYDNAFFTCNGLPDIDTTRQFVSAIWFAASHFCCSHLILFTWNHMRFKWYNLLSPNVQNRNIGKPNNVLINCIIQCWLEYTLPWVGLELTTLVVIGTDRTCSCISNYHETTTASSKVYSSQHCMIQFISTLFGFPIFLFWTFALNLISTFLIAAGLWFSLVTENLGIMKPILFFIKQLFVRFL